MVVVVIKFVRLVWAGGVESKLALERREIGGAGRGGRIGDIGRGTALRVPISAVGACEPCDPEDGHSCLCCRVNGIEPVAP